MTCARILKMMILRGWISLIIVLVIQRMITDVRKPQHSHSLIKTMTTTASNVALAFSVTTQQHRHPLRDQRQRQRQNYRNFLYGLQGNHVHHVAAPDDTTNTTPITSFISGGIIQERHVPLPNGVNMQVICGIPNHHIRTSSQEPLIADTPVLLLLHGSFHSAWCYEEHYIPYLIHSEPNYIVIAPSWRGTAGTPPPPSIPSDTRPTPPKKVKIQEHVDDLYHLIQCIPTILQNVMSDTGKSSTATPTALSSSPLRLYIVCHSFGGIVLLKYLEKYYKNHDDTPHHHKDLTSLAGIVTMCMVPPPEFWKMTLRFLRRSIRQCYQITIGLSMKQCFTNVELCRTVFFDHTMDDATIQRYQSHLQRDSKIDIDFSDLTHQLQSKDLQSENGTAAFIARNNNSFPPCCVIGALHDYLVDTEAVLEAARYFHCYNTSTTTSDNDTELPQVTWIDSAHDVMLGRNWKNGATAIGEWIQQQENKKT